MVEYPNGHKHNELKFKILEATRFEHRTNNELTRILFPKLESPSNEFTKWKARITSTTNRLYKEYDPTKSIPARGYSKPYLYRRWIRSEGEQIRREGRHEYKCTQKGRKMVCEWLYRKELGHDDLKWRGKYFNPMLQTCGIKCDSCPECGMEECQDEGQESNEEAGINWTLSTFGDLQRAGQQTKA